MSTPLSLSVATAFGDVPVSADERGTGRPVVLLHGGAGPVSVAAFADRLARATGTRVITPTHPGFGGTPRPEPLATIGGLAEVAAGLLDALDLEDVVVVGNSIGGWIAAELALLHPPRLGGIALVDAVGVVVDGHPGAAFDALTPAQIADHSWFDPSRAPVLDPATLPPEARAALVGNRAALARYGGTGADRSLLGRLAGVDVPALVVWGEADRIVDPDYGRAYAAAIPGARFVLLPETGHVPQMETPEVLLEALRAFVAA
jgi:pimeloyl-ACP methyl ester carboxylesterase